MPVQHYSDLIAWPKATDLVIEIYARTESFPKSEIFGLTNQMRRASVSIPSNIAEGQGRSSTKDFVHFLHMAKGSLQELETQINIAFRLGFLPEDSRSFLFSLTNETSKILNGLIRSLCPTDH